MKVYGLVGKSGTGKSYQAMNVCRGRKIDAIIDDGLFIYENAIQAGHSAKRDANKMTAVKTAIFNDEEERKTVAASISEVSPEKILVLGTSESMIFKICSRLEIGMPCEMIHIEDIVSEADIKLALKQRRERGKHVIPLPTMEIKKQFSGYFMKPLNIKGFLNGKPARVNEKTVVRPAYSYLGEYMISDRAVLKLAEYAAMLTGRVAEISRSALRNKPEGVTLDLAAVFYYSRDLIKHIEEVQQNVADNVENMTAFNVIQVNIVVKGMKFRKGAGKQDEHIYNRKDK